ncbi:AraC family transcriptional regulator [Sinomicrobium weinanense]|uniref:AraC family transcriptional regulator n=1 Tax=Sinomicrobium weinanense TaxID=2842200 RepID=A0A926Q102_9FLAO|nr:helix-turn-helix domain-containing protein [Sinomicrobium weinanense]MBC9795367.1 AraC family transcriptional regulator [Sinomicrobium weinanense]MBU3122918.1 helix-turn-helix domain-containing protein [Sinomicrobium weinanense]
MNSELHRPFTVEYIGNNKQKGKLDLLLKENGFNILLVNTGYLGMARKGTEIELASRDLCLLTKSYYNKAHIINDSSELWVLSLNLNYLYQRNLVKNAPSFLIFLISLGYSKITLRSTDFIILLQWFKLLILKYGKHYRNPLGKRFLDRKVLFLLRELREIYFSYVPEMKTEYQYKYFLVFRFLQLVETHFKSEHMVKFYANALHVSADHLSKVVKEVTHKPAKECIEEKLITVAMELLGKKEPINSISNILGFKTSSHFAYVFKKHTSFSPSDFRRQGFVIP